MDITERRRAAEALAALETRYRALFENAAEGIIAIDPDSKRFQFFNPALCAMFGYAPDEFGRLTLADIHLPRSDEKKTSGVRPSVRSRQGTETVLVVEDEAAVRNLVRAVLERKGYVVLVAHDGAAALDLVDKHTGAIHVLLTDVVMPGMNGRELAERIVKDHPGVRILYMSGYMDDAVMRHGIVESGVAFLQKPFTPLALARKVREVLDGKAV